MKRIDVPEHVKRFKGYVMLRDPLDYASLAAFSESLDRTRVQFCKEATTLRNKMFAEQDEKKRNEISSKLMAHFVDCVESDKSPRCKNSMPKLAANATLLPTVLACVSEWHVEGIPDNPTPQTFPATPQPDSGLLLGWIIDELLAIVTGEKLEEADPND